MLKEEVHQSSPPSKIPRLNEDEDEYLSLSKPGSDGDEDEDLTLSNPGPLEDEEEEDTPLFWKPVHRKLNEDEDEYLTLSKPGPLEDWDGDEYMPLQKLVSLEDEDEEQDMPFRKPVPFNDEDEDMPLSKSGPLEEEEEEEDEEEDEDEDEEDDTPLFWKPVPFNDEDEDMPLSKSGPLEDEDAPRLLESVQKLPKGAWAQWRSQAVYFVGRSRGFPRNSNMFEGLSIYAIDTTSEFLNVYHVFDFTYPCLYGKDVTDLSCAVVGSSAYVSGNGTSLWVRQIGDKDEGWVEGPQFTRDRRSPELFSLGGRLYALRHNSTGNDDDNQDDAFEVLVDGEWHSLHAPPPFFWGTVHEDRYEPCFLAGWSCIGDSTLIVHLVNYHPDRHRFLRFDLKEDFAGEWTELVSPTPSPFSSPFPNRDFTYASHVYSSDDPLLLPAFSRGAIFPVFGLGAKPIGDCLELKVGEDVPFPWESFKNDHRNIQWHLIGLGRNRYCAVAFDSFCGLHPSVFTFELHLADGAETASLEDVWANHHAFGNSQRPQELLSGKAYFSCTS